MRPTHRLMGVRPFRFVSNSSRCMTSHQRTTFILAVRITWDYYPILATVP